VRWTTRADGDMRPPAAGPPRALRAAAGRPVAWADQVHGARVVVVDRPGPAGCADALVTARPDLALAVLTADCAPVALAGRAEPGGGAAAVAAVHAGWRGLAAGVVAAAVDAVRAIGGAHVTAAIGPCIRAECYRFGAADLGLLVERFGPGVASTASGGGPALDLPAAVRAALADAGAHVAHEEPACTACAAASCFSHRARRDVGRQAVLVWRADG
jgi:polyphenol oxidase